MNKLDKAKRIKGTSIGTAHCFFNSFDDFNNNSIYVTTNNDPDVGGGDGESSNSSSSNFIDFGPFVDQTPITVNPRLPLETVMDLFKKMGVILIEHIDRLVGLITAMNPFRTGKLVMFQVEYDRDWHFFEIFFFIILGIFGGLYGALVIRYNLMIQSFRKKFLLKDYYAVYEAAILASITALIGYLNIFMKMDMTETLGILFQECETKTHDYEGLCKDSEMFRMACLLFIATVLRFGFIIITYGTKVPAGIFIPSMAVGATFGRFLGLFVKALYIAYPEFPLFASCKPDVPCVTPGMYAFLGAAAALGSNGFPFLDKEEYTFGVPVATIMRKNLTVMTASGLKLDEIERILSESNFQGFPVVQDKRSMQLLGHIGRPELKYAIGN
ncbi:13722_t:CDS:10 [Entrophospora sp. SA101]|nr:13722_t:CDS:10 [Entrophospora sp. SA101]